MANSISGPNRVNPAERTAAPRMSGGQVVLSPLCTATGREYALAARRQVRVSNRVNCGHSMFYNAFRQTVGRTEFDEPIGR
jgi:hypothetical protein